VFILWSDQGDRFAFVFRTSSAADAVYVVFGIAWNVVVDDQWYIIHIDAS
jgi:hypothetical protein